MSSSVPGYIIAMLERSVIWRIKAWTPKRRLNTKNIWRPAGISNTASPERQ